MSPLAEAIYEILRLRVRLPDPRITYAELARQLRDLSDEFETINHRSRELYTALTEIGHACRCAHLPPLPALVVRADTRRPGDAYYEGKPTADGVAAWREDLEAVRRAKFPRTVTFNRPSGGGRARSSPAG
jgi:hypothetical protein